MQALPHCRCWLSSNSCRQRPKSRGCSQLQGHPSRGEAVKDGTSQTVEENPQQEELLQQPAALADLDVEVSHALHLFYQRILSPEATWPMGSIYLTLSCVVICRLAVWWQTGNC